MLYQLPATYIDSINENSAFLHCVCAALTPLIGHPAGPSQGTDSRQHLRLAGFRAEHLAEAADHLDPGID